MNDLRTQAEAMLQEQPEELSRLSPEETQRLIQELRVHQIELELQNDELRDTQTALEASRNRYVDLYDFAPVGYLTIDEQGLIVEANLTCASMFGRDRRDLLKRSLSNFIVKADHHAYYRHRQDILDLKTPQSCELRIQRKDESSFWARLEDSPVLDETEQVTQIRIAVTDISELKTLLREKETLMQEILHRTKNNMNMIHSLLSLQSTRIEDEHVLQMFQDLQNRIHSMALVQQKLYQSGDFANIDFQDYLRDLAGTVFENFQTNQGAIALTFDVEPLTVATNTAIHCGLIVSELLSNAMKYAFPAHRTDPAAQPPAIGILLRRTGTGGIELGVRDNGIGLPEGFDVANASSLGLQLVTMLAEDQLRGSLRINNDQGTGFLIRFTPRTP